MNSNGISKIYTDTFSANIYSKKPFRMIGLIDVDMKSSSGTERLTLGFYSSSGTNSGKIKGLWYPIAGIKTTSGEFTEFSDYINSILSITTKSSYVKKGWLAKSLFFADKNISDSKIRGFSNGIYYDSLLEIGETLTSLCEKKEFILLKELDSESFNKTLMSTLTYPGNKKSQKENFEVFIRAG